MGARPSVTLYSASLIRVPTVLTIDRQRGATTASIDGVTPFLVPDGQPVTIRIEHGPALTSLIVTREAAEV